MLGLLTLPLTLENWWPLLSGVVLIALHVTKFLLLEHDDEDGFASLIGIKSSSKNKLLHLDDKYVNENLALVSSTRFVTKVKDILAHYNYNPETTVLATSFCCDQINRHMENSFREMYGNHFDMGGLAGFPFGGLSTFREMAKAVPVNGGCCLIVYGPHIGVDEKGLVDDESNDDAHNASLRMVCTSAKLAAQYVLDTPDEIHRANRAMQDDDDDMDYEQHYVENMLMPYRRRLLECQKSNDSLFSVEVAMTLFEAQDHLMQQIVATGSKELPRGVKVALLGGIQVNTPNGTNDYFLPLKFQLRNGNAGLLENLMWIEEDEQKRLPKRLG